MQLDHQGKAQKQPDGIRLRKRAAKQLIKKKPGFEIRTGGRVLDEAHPIPEVQALGTLFWRGKQPLQTAPEIRCFADIWFGFCISTTQEEHRGTSGDCREDLLVTLGDKFDALNQHPCILVLMKGLLLGRWTGVL